MCKLLYAERLVYFAYRGAEEVNEIQKKVGDEKPVHEDDENSAKQLEEKEPEDKVCVFRFFGSLLSNLQPTISLVIGFSCGLNINLYFACLPNQ